MRLPLVSSWVRALFELFVGAAGDSSSRPLFLRCDLVSGMEQSADGTWHADFALQENFKEKHMTICLTGCVQAVGHAIHLLFGPIRQLH